MFFISYHRHVIFTILMIKSVIHVITSEFCTSNVDKSKPCLSLYKGLVCPTFCTKHPSLPLLLVTKLLSPTSAACDKGQLSQCPHRGHLFAILLIPLVITCVVYFVET